MAHQQTIAFVVIALLQLTYAQVANPGQCPKGVKTVQDLDVAKYLGRWYEHSKYPFIFELGGRCIYAEYGQLSDDVVSVYNWEQTSFGPSHINGTAVIVGPGKLTVRFPQMPTFVSGSNYWVLGTDYKNYAVVYSCNEILRLFHTEVVWILTREREPTSEVLQAATKIIEDNNLSLEPLKKTDQTNCA